MFNIINLSGRYKERIRSWEEQDVLKYTCLNSVIILKYYYAVSHVTMCMNDEYLFWITTVASQHQQVSY